MVIIEEEVEPDLVEVKTYKTYTSAQWKKLKQREAFEKANLKVLEQKQKGERHNEKGGIKGAPPIVNIALEHIGGMNKANKRKTVRLSDRETFERVGDILNEFYLEWELKLVSDNALKAASDNLPPEVFTKLKDYNCWFIKVIGGTISVPYDEEWEQLKKNVYYAYRTFSNPEDKPIFIFDELKPI